MGIITVKTIPMREWKTQEEGMKLSKKAFDRNRKKSPKSVDVPRHYMWFKYLQLCLDLESISHSIPRRGGRGKIISSTKVKVSKSIYRKWDLEKVKKSSFREWYDEDKQELFYDGGFQFSKGTQYHPLVRRFNVFILYTNMMNDKNLHLKGDREKGMLVSELIVEDLQKEEGGQKGRYKLVERGSWGTPMSVQKRVLKDVVGCENTILAVCEGRFPK